MLCGYCGANSFRISRMRPADLPKLLLMLFPVRCRRCNKRTFITVFQAVIVQKKETERHRKERRRDHRDQTQSVR